MFDEAIQLYKGRCRREQEYNQSLIKIEEGLLGSVTQSAESLFLLKYNLN